MIGGPPQGQRPGRLAKNDGQTDYREKFESVYVALSARYELPSRDRISPKELHEAAFGKRSLPSKNDAEKAKILDSIKRQTRMDPFLSPQASAYEIFEKVNILLVSQKKPPLPSPHLHQAHSIEWLAICASYFDAANISGTFVANKPVQENSSGYCYIAWKTKEKALQSLEERFGFSTKNPGGYNLGFILYEKSRKVQKCDYLMKAYPEQAEFHRPKKETRQKKLNEATDMLLKSHLQKFYPLHCIFTNSDATVTEVIAKDFKILLWIAFTFNPMEVPLQKDQLDYLTKLMGPCFEVDHHTLCRDLIFFELLTQEKCSEKGITEAILRHNPEMSRPPSIKSSSSSVMDADSISQTTQRGLIQQVARTQATVTPREQPLTAQEPITAPISLAKQVKKAETSSLITEEKQVAADLTKRERSRDKNRPAGSTKP